MPTTTKTTTTPEHPQAPRAAARQWSRKHEQDDDAGRGQGPGAGVPAPPKPRRRWGLVAVMVALVCLGAFGNVWLLSSTSDAHAVLAASRSIERGALIEREALMSVQVGTDPALRTVAAGQLEALVGQRAAVDIAAGSLLTGESVTSENVPPDGYSLVGIALAPAMMPGTALRAGDRVRVVATPGVQGELASEVEPHWVPAVVLSTASGSDQAGTGAQMIVTVQVPETDAAGLAAMTATGRVAVVLDSRDR